MANPKVRINAKTAREILNGAEVQQEMFEYVDGAAAMANSSARIPNADYVADVQPGVNRAHAMVKTGNYAARLDNARNNTILKAWG